MGVPMKLPWDSAQEIRLEACRFHWHKVYPDRGEDDESYGEEVKSLDFGEEGEERCEDGKGLLFMKWKREDKPITINDGALNYIIKSLNRKIKPQTTMKTHEINS